MWKNYNRFYNQILQSEMSLIERSKGIHKNVMLKKISLTSISKNSPTTKQALQCLSFLHLIMNTKGKVILSKKAKFNSKVRKGTCLGSNYQIRKADFFQFMVFCFFNLLSQLSALNLVPYDPSKNSVSFFIPSAVFLNRILPSLGFFQGIDKIHLIFLFDKVCKEKIFLLRFLKFPVKIFKKFRNF